MCVCEREGERERMEKALTKVSSIKVGSLWITKKAKEEFSNISEDITVSVCCVFIFVSLVQSLYL